eukprot:933533-Rhodomonas_salina.2
MLMLGMAGAMLMLAWRVRGDGARAWTRARCGVEECDVVLENGRGECRAGCVMSRIGHAAHAAQDTLGRREQDALCQVQHAAKVSSRI